MNGYLIFVIVGLAAFGLLVLGKMFAAVGALLLFFEAIVFAFYMLFKDDSYEPPEPPGPKI